MVGRDRFDEVRHHVIGQQQHRDEIEEALAGLA